MSKVKLQEWIKDSNLLLFLCILIVILFLSICCWIFYDAFYPNGIPEHLKEDTEESQDGDAPPVAPANPPAAPTNPPAANANN